MLGTTFSKNEQTMADEANIPKIELASGEMYRDEVFSDLRVGSVRRFTPVTDDGETDDNRAVIYHGQTSLQSPAGPIPLNFELEAKSLSEAMQAFSAAAQAEASRVMKEIEEMQRQQQAQQSGQGGQEDGGRIQML